jgi:hypothetical protein
VDELLPEEELTEGSTLHSFGLLTESYENVDELLPEEELTVDELLPEEELTSFRLSEPCTRQAKTNKQTKKKVNPPPN